jgi:hypothetical protein
MHSGQQFRYAIYRSSLGFLMVILVLYRIV